MKKRKVKVLIRIIRIVAALILLLSLWIRGYAIWGMGLLIIASIMKLAISILDKEKLSTTIGHVLTLMITMYIFFDFISRGLYLQ